MEEYRFWHFELLQYVPQHKYYTVDVVKVKWSKLTEYYILWKSMSPTMHRHDKWKQPAHIDHV